MGALLLQLQHLQQLQLLLLSTAGLADAHAATGLLVDSSLGVLPDRTVVLAAGKKALNFWWSTNPPTTASCDWTDGTLMLGAIEYYKTSQDSAVLRGVDSWAEMQHFRMCGSKGLSHGSATAATTRTSAFAPGPGNGSDDSCRSLIRDVAYMGANSGKPTPAASAGECCRRCGLLGYPKCTYFSFVGGVCSLQATSTIPKRKLG
eukprot:SAG31_NODE_12678_length_925_cov_0.822034_1_plen_203_part_10